MFQTPVITSTANAGQATWLNRRAAARGISAPKRRSTGTSAASVICPPTQMVAASTCRNSLIVSQLTESMPVLDLASAWRGARGKPRPCPPLHLEDQRVGHGDAHRDLAARGQPEGRRPRCEGPAAS